MRANLTNGMTVTKFESFLKIARKNGVNKLVIGQDGALSVEFNGYTPEKRKSGFKKQRDIESRVLEREEYDAKTQMLDHMALENPAEYEKLLAEDDLEQDDTLEDDEGLDA